MTEINNNAPGAKLEAGPAVAAAQDGMENFTLRGYGNGDLEIRGRLFSEASFFDPDNEMVTRMRLFVLPDASLAYSVFSSSGREKQKDSRVYLLRMEEDSCRMDNGFQQMSIPKDLLFSTVFSLCGISGQDNAVRTALEESLRVSGLA